MKHKLAYKLFAAFLLTNLIAIVLLFSSMQYFMRQYFFNFVKKIERERTHLVRQRLTDEYRQTGSWKSVQENESYWHDLLKPLNKPTLVTPYRSPPPHEGRGFPHPPHEGRGFPHPPPPHEGRGFPPPPHRGRGSPPPPRDGPDSQPPTFRSPPELLEEMVSINNIQGPPVKPISHFPPDPVLIAPRLALFDAEKRWIAGRQAQIGYFTLHAIEVNGKIVGWLGIQPIETIFASKDVDFIKHQNRGIYISSLGVLLFSIIITWLLTWHLVKPLNKLTTATQALAARRFSTRVTINTQDELGQLAEDFNQMAETLEHYEQMRQQWLADVAHELRTPLSILRGEVEALQDGIREANAETLESLHAEALHMNRLVEDLRTLSLADSQALNLRRQPINPMAVLRQSLIQIQPRFAQQKLKLKGHLKTQKPPYLAGDSDRLLQVFNNLLENALRYVDKPGELTIHAKLTETHLQLNFIDSGPGVPDFALPHLFERLYRVDKSRSRAKGGSGLGLSICQSIIKAHGGEISADHAPTGGLWIKIILPISIN